MVLLNSVIDGDANGLCWGGRFRLKDDCSCLCSLFSTLGGCNPGEVGFHQDGILYHYVFVLCFNEAFEDGGV